MDTHKQTHKHTCTVFMCTVASAVQMKMHPLCAVSVEEVDGLILCMAVGAETDRKPKRKHEKEKLEKQEERN